MSEIWTRVETDTDESWDAYVKYRDSRHPRKLYRVGAGAPAKLLELFNRHNWQARVAEYDRHCDAIRIAERDAIIAQDERDVVAGQYHMLADAKDLVARELQKYLWTSQETEMHGLLKPSELAKLMDVTLRYDRLVRGESTDILKVEQDLSALSLEELRTLEALYVKAKNK